MSALSDWLDRIYAIRSGPEIEMGLERIRPVFEALNVAPTCPVILVAGTNGKGSVCAYLDAMLRAGGYRTARYTSPHIHRFNERVAVKGVAVRDEELVAAFEAVEAARIACGTASQAPQGLALTFFEYTTLAAFCIFAKAKLDAWIIEVGLGGRLDATNILQPDCSVIVSIGIDHTEFLGNTRELIAIEKAGIMRAGKPVIIGDTDPPQSLSECALRTNATAQFMGRDFGWRRHAETPGQWSFWAHSDAAQIELLSRARERSRGEGAMASAIDSDMANSSADTLTRRLAPPSPARGRGEISHRHALPIPALRGNYQLGNAACALAALHALNDKLPLSQGAIKQGLLEVEWPGRFQVLPGRPTTVLDVAHNEHAAKALERALSDMAYFPVTHAVFAMLKDKDITAVVAAVKHRVDFWYIAPLPGARGIDADALSAALKNAGVKDTAIKRFPAVATAYAAARESADEADRIVVFGSFLTVAQAIGEKPT
jgi:dihydrofolate synthase / folylpolyglutamate synthase